MTEKIKRINNPLTIIAIFAALAEINATVAIGLIDNSLHAIFIWFVIGFPTLLVICFFITLNFNTKVMYSPSDYKDDKSFMDSLFGGNYGKNDEIKTNQELSQLSSELETKITDKLTQRIESIQSDKISATDLKKEIESIKAQIKQVTDESIQEIREESILRGKLKEIMLGYFQFPAYYLLIYALVLSKATTIEQLKKFSERFYIPEHWDEGGLDRLFSDGILVGDPDSFSINKSYQSDLFSWQKRNSERIRLMSKEYRKGEPMDSDEDKNRLRESMMRHSSKLEF